MAVKKSERSEQCGGRRERGHARIICKQVATKSEEDLFALGGDVSKIFWKPIGYWQQNFQSYNLSVNAIMRQENMCKELRSES